MIAIVESSQRDNRHSLSTVQAVCHASRCAIRLSPDPAFFILHDRRIVVFPEYIRTCLRQHVRQGAYQSASKGLLATGTKVAHHNNAF